MLAVLDPGHRVQVPQAGGELGGRRRLHARREKAAAATTFQLGQQAALPDTEAHLAQAALDGEGLGRRQELRRLTRTPERARDPPPVIVGRRQAPACGQDLALAAEADVGGALQAAVLVPDRGRMAHQGEEHAHRSNRKAIASAWAALDSSCSAAIRRAADVPKRARSPASSSNRATAAAKAAAIGFVDRGPDVKVRRGVKRLECLARHGTGEADARAERRHQGFDGGARRAIAHEQRLPRSFTEMRKGVGQHAVGVELVARPHHADAEEKRRVVRRPLRRVGEAARVDEGPQPDLMRARPQPRLHA